MKTIKRFTRTARQTSAMEMAPSPAAMEKTSDNAEMMRLYGK